MTRRRFWVARIKAAHRVAMARVAFDRERTPVTEQALNRAEKYRDDLLHGRTWLVGPR